MWASFVDIYENLFIDRFIDVKEIKEYSFILIYMNGVSRTTTTEAKDQWLNDK